MIEDRELTLDLSELQYYKIQLQLLLYIIILQL
jgi:hypothetical protein